MKNKELVLERLRATREKMNSLNNKNFHYADYVTSSQDGCATVCCILGWYPKWFPEVGLNWVFYEFLGIVRLQECNTVNNKALLYHQINLEIFLALFHGDALHLKNGKNIREISGNARIKTVCKHWDRIIKEIENDNV